jgi:hypothetical protein
VFLPIGQALAGPAMALFGLSGAIWVAAAIIASATAAVFAVRDVWVLRAAGTAAA